MRCITHVSNTPTNNPLEFNGQIELNDGRPSPRPDSRITSAVQKILTDAGVQRGTLSIAIVDDETIHRLNRQYLQHDYPTDVLSFNLEPQAGRGSVNGEIIVSFETAERIAPEIGWSPADEILLYVIHGALHLVGMDDATADEQHEMRAAERRYLVEFGLSPDNDGARDAVGARGPDS